MLANHPPFRPHKLIGLPHFQTVGAFLFKGKQPKYNAQKHIVTMYDGDRLVVHDDQPTGWVDGDRIAVLLHGFCGHHGSPYVSRLSDKLQKKGVRTVRLDFRGFGDSALVSKSHLYGGCSHDVEAVAAYFHNLAPQSKISIIGFSVGGNILMKLAGEWGEKYPRYVDSALAVSPPVDLVYAAWNIRSRGNRLYEAYFIRRLKIHLTMRRRLVKGLIDNGLSPLPNRLMHWDDQFIAPIWGFAGARDYYEKCSAGPLLKHVAVPTVILSAHDDPIVPFDSYSPFTMSGAIQLIDTKRGGHLGFLGKNPLDPDAYWMDWRICNWIEALKQNDTDRLLNS